MQPTDPTDLPTDQIKKGHDQREFSFFSNVKDKKPFRHLL